jgi:adenosylcobinamide-GDP ribazoletransferase
MQTLLSAISFLTTIPVPAAKTSPGRGVIWFPLIGAAIGAFGAHLYAAAAVWMPRSAAALIVILFWTALSGILHEGWYEGRWKFGGLIWLAIALSVVARWQVLEHLRAENVFAVMVAAQAVPRAGMVALAWVSRPTGSGLGLEFSASLNSVSAVISIALGIAAALACGVRLGIVIVLGAYIVIRLVQTYFYPHKGGVNADGFGIAEQLLETLVLILFT